VNDYAKESYLHKWDYDRRVGHLYTLLYKEFADRLLGKNLFLGCNTGSSLQVLRAFGHDVVGLDINKEALEIARGRGCTALYGDATRHMPFADGHFDTILALDFIEHIWPADMPRLVAECARVLRPGGTILAFSPRTDHKKPSGVAMDAAHVQWFKSKNEFAGPWWYHDHFEIIEVRHETRSNPSETLPPRSRPDRRVNRPELPRHDAWFMLMVKK